jgi:hypothetical protein
MMGGPDPEKLGAGPAVIHRATNPCADWPPSGEWSGRAGGALRAIDSTARPRLLADLRSAPPSAAV